MATASRRGSPVFGPADLKQMGRPISLTFPGGDCAVDHAARSFSPDPPNGGRVTRVREGIRHSATWTTVEAS